MAAITFFGNPKVGTLTDFPGRSRFASLSITEGDTELIIFFDSISDVQEFSREVMRKANECMDRLHAAALIENKAIEAQPVEEKTVVLNEIQPS